jgi:hypothetical protein
MGAAGDGIEGGWGPAISIMPFTGGRTVTSASALATSPAAMGWMRTCARRTMLPLVVSSAMRPTNSKNCVAWTIEWGIGESSISFSWASFARR